MKVFIKYTCVTGLLFVFSCSSDNSASDTEKLNQLVEKDTSTAHISNELFDKMIGSVPSPLELSTVIKESGAGYSSSLLNSTNNIEKYNDDKLTAINLGVYGLDLGYMTLYNKSLSTVEYISAINKQANTLNLGQFFNFNLLEKLSSNSNTEALMTESNNSFRKMNSFLIQQRRGEISVFIILGSWIEGVYLTTQIATQNKSKELRERIGEQKKAIDNVLILLSVFKENPQFTDLIQHVQELQKLYEGVTISYVYAKPTQVEVNGEIEIVDNSKNEITITETQFQQITQKIQQIRNTLTKNI